MPAFGPAFCMETLSDSRRIEGPDGRNAICEGSLISQADPCVGDGWGPVRRYHRRWVSLRTSRNSAAWARGDPAHHVDRRRGRGTMTDLIENADTEVRKVVPPSPSDAAASAP